jgi:hypothetical protein
VYQLRIDPHAGVEAFTAAAKSKLVHLVQLTDDGGWLLMAASIKMVGILC